jgi:hypothetical protein
MGEEERQDIHEQIEYFGDSSNENFCEFMTKKREDD